jgi:hypothetical protein
MSYYYVSNERKKKIQLILLYILEKCYFMLILCHIILFQMRERKKITVNLIT